MLERVKYDRLLQVYKNEKPYRGRPQDYPWWQRGHSWKYFNVYTAHDGKTPVFACYFHGSHLFNLYEGNVVQFTKDYYSQGETMILKDCNKTHGDFRQGYWRSGETFFNDEKRGGYCYANVNAGGDGKWQSRTDKSSFSYDIVPIRKNMIFYQETNEPYTTYDILQRTFDKKKTSALTKKYEQDCNSFKVFLSAFSNKKELGEKLWEDYKELQDKVNETELFKDKRFMDLGILVNHSNIRDLMLYGGLDYGQFNGYDLNMVYDEFIKKLNHKLWDLNNAYKTKVIPCEDKYVPQNPRLKIVMRKI